MTLQAHIDKATADKAVAYEARVAAETRLSALEAELAGACTELESAKSTGTPKGEAAKEVSKASAGRERWRCSWGLG